MAEKDPLHIITAVCKDEFPTSAIKKQHTEFEKSIEKIIKPASQTLAKAPGLSSHEIQDFKDILPKPKPAVVEEIAPAPEPE